MGLLMDMTVEDNLQLSHRALLTSDESNSNTGVMTLLDLANGEPKTLKPILLSSAEEDLLLKWHQDGKRIYVNHQYIYDMVTDQHHYIVSDPALLHSIYFFDDTIVYLRFNEVHEKKAQLKIDEYDWQGKYSILYKCI